MKKIITLPKQEIITLHGIPGSGKSSTANELLALLTGFSHTSTGKIAREIGAGYGFKEDTFDAFPKYAREKNIPYDEIIDNRLKSLGNEKSKLIVDSRLGYFFIPNSFKVVLETPLEVAAERIFNDPNRKGKYANVEEVYKALLEREKSDKTKYLELYNTDYSLASNFNYGVPTTFRTGEIANMIFVAFRDWYITN